MWQVDVFMFVVTTDLQYLAEGNVKIDNMTARMLYQTTRLLASSVISGLQSNPRVKNHAKSQQQKQYSLFL
jgi:hypothetical protein